MDAFLIAVVEGADPIEWDVEIVVAALRLSRHTLRKDYRELPSQLLARISSDDLENKSFYASLKEYTPGVTWWRPLKPSLFKPTLEVNRIWSKSIISTFLYLYITVMNGFITVISWNRIILTVRFSS